MRSAFSSTARVLRSGQLLFNLTNSETVYLLSRAQLPLVCKFWQRLVTDPDGPVWDECHITDVMPFYNVGPMESHLASNALP